MAHILNEPVPYRFANGRRRECVHPKVISVTHNLLHHMSLCLPARSPLRSQCPIVLTQVVKTVFNIISPKQYGVCRPMLCKHTLISLFPLHMPVLPQLLLHAAHVSLYLICLLVDPIHSSFDLRLCPVVEELLGMIGGSCGLGACLRRIHIVLSPSNVSLDSCIQTRGQRLKGCLWFGVRCKTDRSHYWRVVQKLHLSAV